jgi:hypothetical protein
LVTYTQAGDNIEMDIEIIMRLDWIHLDQLWDLIWIFYEQGNEISRSIKGVRFLD